MKSRIFTLLLLVGVVYGAVLLGSKVNALRLPDNNRGFQPEQPIAYSHRLHAGELQIECQYCHSGARRSRNAGIPSTEVCMNCHSFVTSTRSQVLAAEEKALAMGEESPTRVMSPEIRKLYSAFGLSDEGKLEGETSPIEWMRVNKIPDFAAFDHRPHIAADVACQTCHGPVETMERVRQVESFSMGFCLDCHRTPPTDVGDQPVFVGEGHPAPTQASTDCSTCHY